MAARIAAATGDYYAARFDAFQERHIRGKGAQCGWRIDLDYIIEPVPADIQWRNVQRLDQKFRCSRLECRLGGKVQFDRILTDCTAEKPASRPKSRNLILTQLLRFPQNMCGCKRSVTAQVDLDRRGEPAQTIAVFLFEQESRLGEVHFRRYRLHPPVWHCFGQDTDSRWIALEGLIREGVHLINRLAHTYLSVLIWYILITESDSPTSTDWSESGLLWYTVIRGAGNILVEVGWMIESVNDINISAVREDELEDMLRVLCLAFQMPFEAALPIFLADTNSLLDNKRVMREDGKIVSCLTIIPAYCRVRGVSFRTAGIAGVATRPDKQGQGCASLLLRNTLAYCRDQGYAFAGLFPVASPYYRKFGFAAVSRTQTITFSCTKNLVSTNDIPVRMANETDLKTLEDMHWESSHTKAVALVRSAGKWQSIFSTTKRIIVAELSGAIVGYLVYEFVLRQYTSIASDTRTPLIARILEIAAASDTAYSALLNYCLVRSEAEQFSLVTDREGSARFRAVSDMEGIKKIEEDELAAANDKEFMLTVLDFRDVIGKLTAGNAVIPALSSPVISELIDTEKGNDRVLIGASCKDETVLTDQSKQAIDSPIPVITGDSAAWTQVLAGYYGAADAHRLGWFKSGSDQAVTSLANVFPQDDPFVSLLDNF